MTGSTPSLSPVPAPPPVFALPASDLEDETHPQLSRPLTAAEEFVEVSFTPKTQRRVESKVIWHKEDEEVLLNMLEDVKASGGAPDSNFKMKTYREIAAKLCLPTSPQDGKKKDEHAVENHWKYMKKCSREVSEILMQSGFGWNTEEHFVEAESAVWERYVKYYSSAQKWRKKPLWYHERVVDLSSASMGTGSFAIDPALLDSSSKAPSSDGEEEGETTGDVKKISTNGKRRAASSGPPERASKRRNGSDQFDRMIEILSGLAGSEAETARETDPVEHATKTLLELDTEHLEIDDVSRLIGHFAEHSGAAKAYTTLAASQASKANDIRRQFLLQILASIEV